MFTTGTREALRETLVAAARADDAVAAAALVGSGATGREDEWSDIDLVLRVAADGEPADVAARWTAAMYATHGAVHHLDVVAGGVLYRVFLLAGSLQVDVSFWPYERFGETQPGFRLLFGETNPPAHLPPPDAGHLIGMAWLHALHARSAIARGSTPTRAAASTACPPPSWTRSPGCARPRSGPMRCGRRTTRPSARSATRPHGTTPPWPAVWSACSKT